MITIEEIIQNLMKAHEQSTTLNQDSPDTSTTQTETTLPTFEAPKYKCPKCKDMGMWEPVYGEGWVVCECQKVRAAEKRIEKSGLAKEIREKTFKSFNASSEWQQTMKNTAIAYGKAYFDAKNEGKKLPWFFIAGQPGCGKTHICTALCGALLNRGIPVVYMQWVTESRKLRAVINEPDFDIMIEPYIDIDVLYIDDLFKQRGHKELNVTDAEGKVLFEILNNRYIQNKATIISTEWYLETELMDVDDGTFSRVYERSKGFSVSIERGTGMNYRIVGG